MVVLKGIKELKQVIGAARAAGQTLGLVPTMGALHEGHLSLVERAGQETDFVVVSIFVNPTQFNDPNDLLHYPRNLAGDVTLLETTSCGVVFAPDADTMYPKPDKRRFDFGTLDKVMEGAYRPGHFNGVAQIVSKLFSIVKPHRAYFGLKDFQQLCIIKSLVRQLKLPIEIVPCPIVREADGLAKSSRNQRLTPEQRYHAPLIYRTLKAAVEKAPLMPVAALKEWVVAQIDADPLLHTEYFDIVDDTCLSPVERWEQPSDKVGCIAAFCGSVRLIDNIMFKNDSI
jgi:pantoate--beta-alanine ligase